MAYCAGIPIPRCYVSKADSERRRNYFLQHKYGPLCEHLGKPEVLSIFYHVFQFKSLLNVLLSADGARIYIASYPNEGATTPGGYGNRLTLIYAPVNLDDEKFRDRGDYYILDPSSNHKPIVKESASQWVRNYQDRKLPLLTSVTGLDSDTKSVLYTKATLQEIKAEIECQSATGIRIYFASYTDKEASPIGAKYLKRLIIQFTLTENIQGVEKDFYIDERPGFNDRPPSIPVGITSADVLDTGSPCPPAQCYESLPGTE